MVKHDSSIRELVGLLILTIRNDMKKLIWYANIHPKNILLYDNYDAIEVSKTSDIPCDYPGKMGVPITFLDKYNPEQFEIIGQTQGDSGKELGLAPYPRELKKLNNKPQRRTTILYEKWLS